MMKTINGIAQYPEGYQGTPHRAPSEDPFISPSNAALVLIDYQPHILMGVKSIDHEDLGHRKKINIRDGLQAIPESRLDFV